MDDQDRESSPVKDQRSATVLRRQLLGVRKMKGWKGHFFRFWTALTWLYRACQTWRSFQTPAGDVTDDMLWLRLAGCMYRGQLYHSGSQWVSDVDPCVHYYCQAAVLTRSITKCVITCSNPIILPNHCCPHCPGETYVIVRWSLFANFSTVYIIYY